MKMLSKLSLIKGVYLNPCLVFVTSISGDQGCFVFNQF